MHHYQRVSSPIAGSYSIPIPEQPVNGDFEITFTGTFTASGSLFRTTCFLFRRGRRHAAHGQCRHRRNGAFPHIVTGFGGGHRRRSRGDVPLSLRGFAAGRHLHRSTAALFDVGGAWLGTAYGAWPWLPSGPGFRPMARQPHLLYQDLIVRIWHHDLSVEIVR